MNNLLKIAFLVGGALAAGLLIKKLEESEEENFTGYSKGYIDGYNDGYDEGRIS